MFHMYMECRNVSDMKFVNNITNSRTIWNLLIGLAFLFCVY